MSYVSTQRNAARQNDLRSQLGRIAQRGNNITKLLQQAQQQGKADKVNRILRSRGIDSKQLQQVLSSNGNKMQTLQNIMQQAKQNDLLILNQESLLLVNAPEGTLLAASDQSFLFGGENDDNGIIALNDEGLLYVQDRQTGNTDVYQFDSAPNGDMNGQVGAWGDDENYVRSARRDRSIYW